MKLEGSLDAFGLPDIFQLLSHTRKTGGLHLRRGGADGVVYFEEGAVCGASADERQQTLARRLVGSGTVDDEALRAAVQRAVSDRVGIGRALLESHAVDPELLREAATEQTFDAVFDLMCWTEGDFAFAGDETDPDGVGLRLPADQVVEEAQTRRAAWEAAASGVPSPETVLAMPVVLEADPSLTRDEWALLALVDGRRPVREIVELTGAGQFAVVSTLSRLVERGLLGVRDDTHDHAAVVARRLALLAPLERGTAERGSPELDRGGAEEPAAAEEPEPAPAEATSQEESQPEAVTAQPVETTSEPTLDDSDPTEPDGSAAEEDSRDLQPVGISAVRQESLAPTMTADQPSLLSRVHVSVSQQAASPLRVGDTTLGGGLSGVGGVVGSTATAPELAASAIERDPNVNRSLLLRLIAGVRGL